MTKSSKIRIALTVLALAAFTAIFFSIPALRIKRHSMLCLSIFANFYIYIR